MKMNRAFALMCIGCLFALASVGHSQLPDPVGWWLFDEGEGTVAKDASGNGYDGAIAGATWTEGQYGSALEFGGSDGVEISPVVFDNISLQASMTFWAFGADALPVNTIVFRAANAGGNRQWGAHLPWGNGQVYLDSGATGGGATYDRVNAPADESLYKGTWTHWAFVKNAETGELTIYANGAVHVTEATGNVRPIVGVTTFIIGSNPGGANGYQGILDDVRLYDQALSAEQIQETMLQAEFGSAGSPNPSNGATDVLRDVGTLSWSPGDFAATHNVYFGTNFDDVNDGTALVAEGITETTFDPGRLAFGTQYFWRVDEVNSPPDSTVFPGDVWSFTVEPLSLPLANVTATATSTFGDSGPERTVDGSGLVDDLHGTAAIDMWISGGIPASIEYTFDQAYKLHELWIWNSNQTIESFVGFGAKDVVIEYSLDGENWTVLDGVGPLAQASGTADYAAGNIIDFGGNTAQYVRITVNSVQGFSPQVSLSEVRFFYLPVKAREPNPGDGAATDGVDVAMSWRAGREAGQHEVYLGTESDSLAMAATTSENRYVAEMLDYATIYYWQVVEVNEAETPTRHAGDIWIFSTPEYAVVDDFEMYADEEFFEIWSFWIDGFDDPDNGALVGNGNIGDTTVVHGGNQSMPIEYDNSTSATSEVTLAIDGQDWTAGGLKTLSLFIHGTAGNTGQLYLKINDTRVDYSGDAADLAEGPWRVWPIDLSTVAGNLQNVTSLTIGVAGGSGRLLVDDIRLYPLLPEFITPVEPDSTGLLAHYAFDGDFSDSAGNNDATALGDALVFNDPVRGQVLRLDGDDDAIDIPLLANGDEVTISMWVNPEDVVTPSNLRSTFHGDGWTSGDIHWRVSLNRNNGGVNGAAGGNLEGTGVVPYGQWSHIALILSPSQFSFGLNGVIEITRPLETVPTLQIGDGLIGAWMNGANIEREWAGWIDDVRIYERALTAAELLGLAGKTAPVAKPF